VVVVPEFSGYEDSFTLYKTLFHSAVVAFASFFFVLVVVCAVVKSVARFDSLQLLEQDQLERW
jgi:hypothetical protein